MYSPSIIFAFTLVIKRRKTIYLTELETKKKTLEHNVTRANGFLSSRDSTGATGRQVLDMEAHLKRSERSSYRFVSSHPRSSLVGLRLALAARGLRCCPAVTAARSVCLGSAARAHVRTLRRTFFFLLFCCLHPLRRVQLITVT